MTDEQHPTEHDNDDTMNSPEATDATESAVESAAEAVDAKSTLKETTSPPDNQMNTPGKNNTPTDHTAEAVTRPTTNNVITPDKPTAGTETTTQQVEEDRPEHYIKGTNTGLPTKISATVFVCFTHLDPEGKLVAENVNQAVPQQEKILGLLKLVATGKSGDNKEMNDSQIHLHFSKKAAEDDSAEDCVSLLLLNLRNEPFCKIDHCTNLGMLIR